MYEIGQYLRSALKKKRMKQKDLAQAMDMSQEHISKICLNKALPSMDALVKICTILDMSFPEFFSCTENTPSISVSTDEQALILNYRHLHKYEQQAVASLVSSLNSGHQRKHQNEVPSNMRQVSGYAAAGSPLCDGDIDEFVPVPPEYLDSSRFVIIKAKGDSMEPDIHDGDYVVADRNNPSPLQSEKALVSVEGMGDDYEYAIKKIYYHGNDIELVSTNPSYPPMIFKSHQIKSAYKIVYVIHKRD